MFYGGVLIRAAFITLVVYYLFRGPKDRLDGGLSEDDAYRLTVHTRDPVILWDSLSEHASHT